MPAVLRDSGNSVQDSGPTTKTEPDEEISSRQHSFSIPEELWQNVDVAVLPRRPAEPLRIRIENGLPHGVPTGEFGRRELRIRVRWQGGAAERVLRADLGQAVPAGAVRVFALPGVPDGADWTVLLERRNPERAEFVRVIGISRDRHPALEADR
jgi:hypothetical protein